MFTIPHFRTGESDHREHRLLWQTPPAGGLDNLPSGQFSPEKHRTWKESTAGADELLAHFAIVKPTKEELKKYVAPMLPNHLVNDVKNNFYTIENNSDPHERIAALAKIESLLTYIEQRNAALKKTKEDIRNIRPDQDAAPLLIENVTSAVKNTFSTCIEGFQQADGKNKAIMLAGAVSTFLILRYLWKGAGSIPGVKKAVGLTLGLGVSWMAFEAVNRSYENINGKPLVSWTGLLKPRFPGMPLVGFTQEQWDEAKRGDELKKIDDRLKGLHLPDSFFEGFRGDAKYAKGICNITTLTLEKFAKLYASGKSSGEVQSTNPHYPKGPFAKDDLNPVKRWALIDDVAKALNLTDEQIAKLPPAEKQQSILYRIFENIK